MGVFANTVINLAIVAFAIFLLVRAISKTQEPEEKPTSAPTTRECPHCLSKIPIKATRCAHCTQEIPVAAA